MDKKYVASELLKVASILSRNFVASELVKVAKDLVSYEFDSEEALKKYLKEHPKADKSLHHVKKKELKQEKTEEKKPKKGPNEQLSLPFEKEADEYKPGKDASPHKKVKPQAQHLDKVQNILKSHGLKGDEDEIQEMTGFKKTLGQRVPEKDYGKWYVRNSHKLKADFLKNMNASNYASPQAFKRAQSRIKEMPASDFVKILSALVGEDEEE